MSSKETSTIKTASSMLFGGVLRSALTNERLFLMGLTSLALSLASGWTTFEGMTNFTKSPVLCFLITFGVQGIMLVSAWMIGEALISLRQKKEGGTHPAGELFRSIFSGPATILKVWLIWMVFLFSMAISVFFSFDSLFSSIFSDEERRRAGEIRAQSEVGAVLSDLKKRIETRKFEAIDTLLASNGWREYNGRLDELGKIARSAPERVEQQLLSKLQAEQSEIAKHQETLAQAKGQKVALETRQQKISAAIARLKADRPTLSAEVTDLRQKVQEKQRLIDQKQAEALEESRGIGATGREGQGPKFRAIKDQQRRLTAERDVLQTQKTLAANRLEALDSEISKLARELELLNGEVAKIEGQAAVATRFIKAQSERQTQKTAEDLSATASINSLDQSRDRFRQKPSQETFLNIQKNCTNLHNALSEVQTIGPNIKTISCEPGAATATLAAQIFTLQAAGKQQAQSCTIDQVGAGARQSNPEIDKLLQLGKGCIQQSGLPETDANELRTILNRVDLNRDDKAKNFVVTLNAFKDGNWLAYLALGLAIAIDSLVFISGLIGAKTASYENTGSPSDIMKYGLGMSSEIQGNEPEDIYTRKIFFQSVCGPSPEEGYLAIVDTSNLTASERSHVNKVLTIAGTSVKPQESNPAIYHIEEKFYQNLARQVYLWDKFNRQESRKPTRRAVARKSSANDNSQNEERSFTFAKFGKEEKGSTIRHGENSISFFKNGPKEQAGPYADPAATAVPITAQTSDQDSNHENESPRKNTPLTMLKKWSSPFTNWGKAKQPGAATPKPLTPPENDN